MSAPCEFELLDKLELGALVIDYPEHHLIFSNQYFRSIAGTNEPVIIDHILSYLDSGKPNNLRRDMRIGTRSVIGFTIYKLSETRFLVFLNDVSYKKIYLENREDNFFYDRLSRLTAEMAHEMGNPLSSVTTTLQVLYDSIDTWSTDKKKEYLMGAIGEIERLSQYLSKIRNFSSGDEHILTGSISLRSVIDRVIDHHEIALDSRKIEVTCSVAPIIYVEVDDYALFQVLSGLFLNAIDILPETRGGKIWITLEELNEFYAKLVFRNNGPLVPKEKLEKQLVPFFIPGQKECGIGLATATKLMTRMGGKLEAESPDDGLGPRYILYIPVSPD